VDRYISYFFFSSRRRHTRLVSDWSSDVCSSDLRSTRTGEAPPTPRKQISKTHPQERRTCEYASNTATAAIRSAHELSLMQQISRSEERRVGKESRSRWSPGH